MPEPQIFTASGAGIEVRWRQGRDGAELEVGPNRWKKVRDIEQALRNRRYDQSELLSYVIYTAAQNGVDPTIFINLLRQESGLQHWDESNLVLKSRAGAIGFGQLMPGTAKGLGVDPYDPVENLQGSARYLKQQVDAYDGDYQKAVAAYFVGPGNLQQAVRQDRDNWLAVLDQMVGTSGGGYPSAYVGNIVGTSERVSVHPPQSATTVLPVIGELPSDFPTPYMRAALEQSLGYQLSDDAWREIVKQQLGIEPTQFQKLQLANQAIGALLPWINSYMNFVQGEKRQQAENALATLGAIQNATQQVLNFANLAGSVVPGLEYAPGWQPGGPMEALYQWAGRPFEPMRAPQVDVTVPPWINELAQMDITPLLTILLGPQLDANAIMNQAVRAGGGLTFALPPWLAGLMTPGPGLEPAGPGLEPAGPLAPTLNQDEAEAFINKAADAANSLLGWLQRKAAPERQDGTAAKPETEGKSRRVSGAETILGPVAFGAAGAGMAGLAAFLSRLLGPSVVESISMLSGRPSLTPLPPPSVMGVLTGWQPLGLPSGPNLPVPAGGPMPMGPGSVPPPPTVIVGRPAVWPAYPQLPAPAGPPAGGGYYLPRPFYESGDFFFGQ